MYSVLQSTKTTLSIHAVILFACPVDILQAWFVSALIPKCTFYNYLCSAMGMPILSSSISSIWSRLASVHRMRPMFYPSYGERRTTLAISASMQGNSLTNTISCRQAVLVCWPHRLCNRQTSSCSEQRCNPYTYSATYLMLQ
jgi:hypothetical protein